MRKSISGLAYIRWQCGFIFNRRCWSCKKRRRKANYSGPTFEVAQPVWLRYISVRTDGRTDNLRWHYRALH